MFRDAVKFWNSYRDWKSGLYCDFTMTNDNTQCGSYLGNWVTHFYNSASTGFGLIADAIQVEVGLLTRDEGRQRAYLVRFVLLTRNKCVLLLAND